MGCTLPLLWQQLTVTLVLISLTGILLFEGRLGEGVSHEGHLASGLLTTWASITSVSAG